MMAAQGFQESRLNQNAKSQVGAIGVMQVMPATGKELGVGDIRQIEANIHAGVKYMDQLMSRYFKDAKFDEQNRALFAFAAYNAGWAGSSRCGGSRRSAGSNADVWFRRRDRHCGEGRIERRPMCETSSSTTSATNCWSNTLRPAARPSGRWRLASRDRIVGRGC